MAIFERTTEYSVLRSLGTRPGMVFNSVILSLSEPVIRAATENFSRNAQIHQKTFVKNFEVEGA